jgi:hypothetical protein
LNQNRNNNRRRGRGNNRGGQGGGGPQGNRIDSRARGNAPQMLEKYRKLAHDASLNGDRVQTEYYLQFADHYFRVVADSRVQTEARPRRDDRDQPYDGEQDDGGEMDDTRGQRDDRSNEPEDSAGRSFAGGGRNRDDRPRDDRPREERPRNDRGDDNRAASEEGQRGAEGDAIANGADENPFIREAREPREPRGRGRGRARPANDAGVEAESGADTAAISDDSEPAFDAGILPPSIARDEEAAPRPARTRTRRPRRDDGDEEALEAVS